MTRTSSQNRGETPLPILRFLPFVLLLSFYSAPGFSAEYALSVENGTGSGTYDEGAIVDISAYPAPVVSSDQLTFEPADPRAPMPVFDRWLGDTDAVDNPRSARTTLLMPAADTRISAGYKDVPRWQPPRVMSALPASIDGVIFVFHGGGGSAAGPFLSSETRSFIQEAFSRKLAVIAIDSFDRKNKVWDMTVNPAQNIDMQRVAAVRRDLISQGRLRGTEPTYFVGISNGGAFASLWTAKTQRALGMTIRSAALIVSSFAEPVIHDTKMPTIFAIASNDSTLNGVLNDAARQSFNNLLAADVPSQLLESLPTRFPPDRFLLIDGLSLADGEALHAAFLDSGILDRDNWVAMDPNFIQWRHVIPNEYSAYTDEIRWQVFVAYAEHAFMRDFNDEIIDFLVAPTTSVETPPSIQSISPDSGYAYTPVEIQGHGFYDVRSIELNGSSVSDFNVVAGSKIRFRVPVGVSSGTIKVITPAGAAITPEFEVLAPSISAFSPKTGTTGTLVRVDGEGFFLVNSVKFGGVPAEVVRAYPKVLFVRVPSRAKTGPITVLNYAGEKPSDSEFVVTGS